MVRYILILTGILVITSILLIFFDEAKADETRPRVTKNPYASVNWDKAQMFLANFHSHTVYSDGRAEPDELINMYADAGYHILAITDHDNAYNHREGERDIRQLYTHREGNIRVPTAETTWPWTRWIKEKPSRIWAYQGWETSAFYPDLGERGLLAIRGNELTTDPHIVSLFNTCGWPVRGQQTDDERMSCVDQKGGLSYWAHPTDYVPGGRWEDRLFDVNWEEAVSYIGDYIVTYSSNMGIEMQLGGRLERDLEMFDRLLMKHYPDNNIFVMGSDDNHGTSVPENTTLTLVLAEDLTEEAVRYALENGHNFVGSRTDVYPQINKIIVDEQMNTISLDIDNYESVRWIVNGMKHSTGNMLDYSKMKDSVARFEVDQGGVTFYSQGFYIQ